MRNSINNLRTFPYIKEREADGRLKVHGAWFDISTGELWVMNPETGDFLRPEIDDQPLSAATRLGRRATQQARPEDVEQQPAKHQRAAPHLDAGDALAEQQPPCWRCRRRAPAA